MKNGNIRWKISSTGLYHIGRDSTISATLDVIDQPKIMH
jgi:hypothetical protein